MSAKQLAQLIELRVFFKNSIIIVDNMKRIARESQDTLLNKYAMMAEEGIIGMGAWADFNINHLKQKLGTVIIPVDITNNKNKITYH